MAEVTRGRLAGTSSVAVGILGTLLGCLPFYNFAALLLGPLAFALGLTAVYRGAGTGRRRGVVGIVLGLLSLALFLIVWPLLLRTDIAR